MAELSDAQYEIFFGSEKKGRFRIFPKGRRLGATRGAAVAFTFWMQNGEQCLWGDTINSNIDRYLERYFIPFLKRNNIPYHWHAQKKILKVADGHTDFRSADRPENWEGFGYHKVFLNEAGIILHDEYLFENAVLPMLIDFPKSTLIAAGTPKTTRGVGRLFKELWERVESNEPGYAGQRFSTYDNPFLDIGSIKTLESTIAAAERQQEIYGHFIDQAGVAIRMDWFQRYQHQPANFDRIVQSWDTAYKPKEVNDPSVCTTWGVTPSAYYLLHVYRGWVDYPTLKRNVINLAEKHAPNEIIIEDKASGQSLIQEMRNETALPIIKMTPTQDKITRALVESTAIETGRVFLPTAADWLFDYEAEWSAFPNPKTWDQIDSTTQFLARVRTKPDIFVG